MISELTDYSSNEQQHILGAFNKCKVKYVGFDAFAINSYAPTLPFGDIQIWTKPTVENFEAIRNAIKLATGHNNRLIIRRKTEDFLAHENTNQAFMEIGFSNRKIKIFPVIPGLSDTDFDIALQEAQLRKVGRVNSKILSIQHAYQSMEASQNRHKDKFLQQLEILFPKVINKHSSQKRKSFEKKDFNNLIKNIDIEIALENLGYKFRKDKSGVAQHLWSRNTDDRKVIVYMNQGGDKGYFDLNDSQSKGTVIDLLIKEFNKKWFEIFEFCDKILVNPELANLTKLTNSFKTENIQKLKELNIEEQTKLREKSIRENHEILPFQKPQYLNERGINNEIIYSPEFLGQINNIPYHKNELTYYNTAFPMRNEFGLTNFIVRFNNNLSKESDNNRLNKYYLRGEKLDACWMSNELYITQNEIYGKHINHLTQIAIPENSLGILHKTEKDGQINHYFTFKTDFLDNETIKSLKLKPNSTIQLMLANDSGLEKAKADRIVITESPIDAISFAQMMGKASEYNLYIATGGHPSPNQIQLINRIVRHHACEVVLAMDNEHAGLRFNTTIAGGIQHPLCDSQKDIFFKVDYVNDNQYVAQFNDFHETNPKIQLKGECHLSIEFSKNLNMPKSKIEGLIQKAVNYIGSFLNKETVKLIEANSSETTERYKIALPNNRTQLKRAIDSLLNIRTTEASQNQALFTLKKPILKDWNDDLMYGKKHVLDAPLILNEIPNEKKSQRLR